MFRPVAIGEQVLNRRGAEHVKRTFGCDFSFSANTTCGEYSYNKSGYTEVEQLADSLYGSAVQISEMWVTT